MFSFNVVDSSSSSLTSEISLKRNECQCVSVEIKRVSQSWPSSLIFVEEVGNKYFDESTE